MRLLIGSHWRHLRCVRRDSRITIRLRVPVRFRFERLLEVLALFLGVGRQFGDDLRLADGVLCLVAFRVRCGDRLAFLVRDDVVGGVGQ